MTSPTIPTQAAREAAAKLRALIDKATSEDLSDDGRYFADSLDDLTRCRHEEIGEYQHSPDGKLIEWLWNRRGEIAALYDDRATFERETVAKTIERVLAQEDDLTRPIIGIDNRTALEAFDIMHDRIVRKFSVIRNLTDGSQ